MTYNNILKINKETLTGQRREIWMKDTHKHTVKTALRDHAFTYIYPFLSEKGICD